MLAECAIEEARALAARGLDPLLPAMKAHGVPGLIRHLRGEISLAEAAEKAKQDTRHYAKRQFTWFRHQLADWPQVAPDKALDWLREALAEAEKASPLHRPSSGPPPPFHGGG
jgi:tRNA dimethylallyltransferase